MAGGMCLMLLVAASALLCASDCRPLLRGESRIGAHRAVAILEPDPGHTRLTISAEGLDLISRIEHPVSVVAVIGPYRSGKSFLLNQLLSLSCDEGFGVGHMRDTKTRGVWFWGEPREVKVGDLTTSVLYIDTEGFESIGKSNVYDDRIFAFAALMSSVLIYNLPETVREADISKLSFAVELGEEFYGRVKGRQDALEAARLLWLIQRDFLEGKTVRQLVNDALQPVDNPTNDKDIEQVNRIRESLRLMAKNSTAFGLPQPHLHRTKLCEMDDSNLEKDYIERREELKKLVDSLIAPKVVQGKMLNGKEFAAFLKQMLHALNEGDFPSAGSVVDVFNTGLVERCMETYNSDASRLNLPVLEDALRLFHHNATNRLLQLFDRLRFGRRHGEDTMRKIQRELDKAYAVLKTRNDYLSSKRCDKLYMSCEDSFERLQGLRLPSMAKFTAGIEHCNRTFVEACRGTSKAAYEDRLQKMMTRAKSHFLESYNQRLFNWLVAFSLIMVVVGRFFLKSLLVEFAAWALFVFLETYTRIFWSADMLYYNPLWHTVVSIWEAVIYNPVLDLDRWFLPLAWMVLLALLFWRFRKRKRAHPRHRRSA